MKGFLACMVFCGCTIDSALDSSYAAVVWLILFISAVIIAAVLGGDE